MPTLKRTDKIKRIVAHRQIGAVVFENIHDPHNAEAVIRSADAFGIQRAYFIFEKEPAFDPLIIGKASSSSANKWVDFRTFNSVSKCISHLKKLEYEIIATVIDEKSDSIFESMFIDSIPAFCFGNEKLGLSKALINSSDRKVTIPMLGMVQSLNLSVTAAIFLYELTRQRMNCSNKNFQFPQKIQKQMFRDLMKR